MTNKKGFTLIELMVVIVIIGILAAVAIPKLLGMSNKAKAAEAPQMMHTYETLQSAQLAELSKVGDLIGQLNLPTTNSVANSTKFFKYTEVSNSGTLVGTAAVNFGDCVAASGVWSLQVNDKGQVGRTPPTEAKCSALTPSYEKTVIPASAP